MLSPLLLKRHLEEDETLIGVVHQHWLFGVTALFWPTLLLAVTWSTPLLFPASELLLYGLLLTSVVLGVWWLRNFFDYFLDAWIITDQGIIDIAWHGWFHRESTRVVYSDLQGISYEIKGVMGTLLRFGTISIEKMSTGSHMSLPHVRRPRSVEALVLKCQEAYLHTKNMTDATQVQALLSSMVAQHMQLQKLTGKPAPAAE